MIALEGAKTGGEVDGPGGVDYEGRGAGKGGVCFCVETERRVGEGGGEAVYLGTLTRVGRVGRGRESRKTWFAAPYERFADTCVGCDGGGGPDKAGYFRDGRGEAEEMEDMCAESACGAGEDLWELVWSI